MAFIDEQFEKNNQKVTEVFNSFDFPQDRVDELLNQYNEYWAFVDRSDPLTFTGNFGIALTAQNLVVRLNSVYTVVNANSGFWNSSIANLMAGSVLWNSVYNTVKANSATWGSGNSNVDTVVQNNSAAWIATTNTVNASSIYWSSVYTNVNNLSARWESAYTTVNANSSTWVGGGTLEYTWKFDSATTASDPGSQKFKLNNSNPSLVTALYISETTVDNDDVASILGLIGANDRIFIKQQSDSNRLIYLQITGAGTDNGSWWTFPVSVIASLTIFQNNQNCDIALLLNATGNTAETEVDTVVQNTSANWNSVYTTVNGNSGVWGTGGSFDGSVVTNTSAAWNSNYSTTNANSANWDRAYIMSNILGGLSANWNSVFSNVNGLSSNWDRAYVMANILAELSANGQSVYSQVNLLSTNWSSVFSTTNTNSANWDRAYVISTILAELSANARSVYSQVNTLSTNWSSVYSNVNANSGNYILDGGNTKGAPIIVGTNDLNDLRFETNNLVRMAVSSNGIIVLSGNASLTRPHVTHVTDDNTGFSFTGNDEIYFQLGGNAPSVAFSRLSHDFYYQQGVAPFQRVSLARGGANVNMYSDLDTDGSLLGRISFEGVDDNDDDTHYSKIEGKIVNNDDGAEQGELIFKTFPSDDSVDSLRVRTDELSARGIIYASGGNSDQWNRAYILGNILGGLSANWNSVFSNVNGLSSNWDRAYVMANVLGGLSANWNSVYSQVNLLSTNWSSVFSTTNSNSANWDRSYAISTILAELSANSQSVYSNVNSNSANWNAFSQNSGNYATLQSNRFTGTQTIATVSSTQLILSGAPITTNIPFLSALQIWDNAGVTFQGFVIDITDQNSHVNSMPFEVRRNGSMEFRITRNPTKGIQIADEHGIRTNGANGVIFTVGGTPWMDYGNSNGVGLQRDRGKLIFGQGAGAGVWSNPILQQDDQGNNFALALKNSTNAMAFRIYGTTSNNKMVEFNHDGTVANINVSGGGSLNISSSALWVTSIIRASAGNSDEWNSVYNTVLANSATWGSSSDNEEVNTVVENTSANWNSVYSQVNSNSATWETGGGNFATLFSNTFSGVQVVMAPASSSALVLSGGTVNVSRPVLSATQTWNDASVTFVGPFFEITDIDSANASTYFQVNVNGRSHFKIPKIRDGIAIKDDHYWRTSGSNGWIFTVGGSEDGVIDYSNSNGVGLIRDNGKLHFGQYASFNPSDTPVLQRDTEGGTRLALKNGNAQMYFRVYGNDTDNKLVEITHDGTVGTFTVSGGGSLNIAASALWANCMIHASAGNSDLWTSVYSTVNANSANWGNGGGNPEVDTVVTTTSANWNSVYSNVNTNSATWGAGSDDVEVSTLVHNTSSNWNQAYTALTSTSAQWVKFVPPTTQDSLVTWTSTPGTIQGTTVQVIGANMSLLNLINGVHIGDNNLEYNTRLGFNALRVMDGILGNGSRNTAIGHEAFETLQSESVDNIAIGEGAGKFMNDINGGDLQELSVAMSSIFIGNRTRFKDQNTSEGVIVIGHDQSDKGNNTTVIGHGATTEFHARGVHFLGGLSSGEIRFYTSSAGFGGNSYTGFKAPDNRIGGGGSVTFTLITADGGKDYVLTTNGAAKLEWQNPVKWYSVYTQVNNLSSNWNSAYSTVNAQSANNASVFSSFNAQSANNASVYSTVNANSASWSSPKGTLWIDFGNDPNLDQKTFQIQNTNINDESIVTISNGYKAQVANFNTNAINISVADSITPIGLCYGDSYDDKTEYYINEIESVQQVSGVNFISSNAPLAANAGVYGNDSFVFIGSDNSIIHPTSTMRSRSGATNTWVTVSANPGDSFRGSTPYITYGGGKFILSVRSSDHSIYTSQDAFSWTEQNTTVSDLFDFRGLTYGNGLFVGSGAQGTSGCCYSMDNGTSWFVTSAHASVAQSYPCYGRRTFYMAGTGRLNRSLDNCATWSVSSLPASDTNSGIVYGNGMFLLVTTTFVVWYSYDGQNWNRTGTGIGGANSFNMAYGNGMYVIVGGSSTIASSTNGVTWSGFGNNLSEDVTYNAVTYGNGKFIAAANTGVLRMAIINLKKERPTKDVNYKKGAIVIPTKEKKIYTIMDDKTWSVYSMTAVDHLPPITTMKFLNNMFVGLAYDTIFKSHDGVTWEARQENFDSFDLTTTFTPLDIAYGNDTFVAIGSGGRTRVLTSYDNAVTWHPMSAVQSNSWNSIAFGRGSFVSVSPDGSDRIMITSHGVSSTGSYGWSAVTAPEQNSWASIAYGNDKFVAVAPDGANRVMISNNGLAWSAISASDQNPWGKVTYGNGVFMATASAGQNRIMYSRDAVTWTSLSSTNQSWGDICFVNGANTYSNFMSIAQDTSNSLKLLISDTSNKSVDEFEMDKLVLSSSVTANGSFAIDAKSVDGTCVVGKFPINYLIS